MEGEPLDEESEAPIEGRLQLHRSPVHTTGRSSRREASLNRSVDSALRPSVRLNEAAFTPARRSKNIFGVRPPSRSDCLRADVFTKGWMGVQPQGKDRLQDTSRKRTVTTAQPENPRKTAILELG